MKNERLRGKRYVCLIRCSTNEQAKTSVPDQLAVLTQFAQENGLIHSDGEDLILDGVSGSRPGARSDIDEIIERKQRGENFEILLVQDVSRLTRGGSDHGGSVEWQLLTAGIELVFANGSIPEGDHAGIVKSVEYFSAQQFARSLSFGVARGQMSAILEGRMVYCLRPPYGVDKMFLSMDGQPSHVIRNLPSGVQQKLDAKTGRLIESYPPPVRGQQNLRYRKQKSERVILIPGAPEQVAAVRQIFRRKLIDGWGGWRIAMELNNQGLPGATGKPWSQEIVKQILRNRIYVGVGVANRRTQAIYNVRSANQPARSELQRRDLAKQKRPKNRRRPQKDWIEQNHPALEGYLGDELRERAITYQTQILNRPIAPPIRPDRHVDSAFILKSILRSKQGGHRMTGRTQGTKAKPYRYYHISSASKIPTSDRTMRGVIRAEPLEQAVLSAVRELLLSSDQLRPQIEAAIQAQVAAVDRDGDDMAHLTKERERLAQKVEFVIDELEAIGKDAAKAKIRQFELQLAALDARIAKANKPSTSKAVDVAATADQILARLDAMGRSIDAMPPHGLRTFLSSIISKLEVDMETRAVEIEFALPNGAKSEPKAFEARMGFDEKFLQKDWVEAQGFAVRLAAFECVRMRSGALGLYKMPTSGMTKFGVTKFLPDAS